MESIDLFEHYDILPNELQKLLNKFSELDNTYFECEILLNECKKIGYTFDYYLDAIPFNLKKIDMTQYNYVIIKESYPELERESVLTSNNYKKSKRYAFICKGVHKDGSESIYFIQYSNDLQALQEQANNYISWYNYPMKLTKNIQGYVTNLN